MNSEKPSRQNQSSGNQLSHKIQIALAVALALVAAGMYAWKVVAVNSVEERLTQTRNHLLQKAREFDARRSEETLRKFSMPLAWAIRRELMAGNLDQIDQYFTALVQMEGFRSAVLARPDGKIIAATDRKRLAQPFSSVYPPHYLQARSTSIEHADSATLRAVIPILGLNQQVGTAVVEYTPKTFSLN